MLSLPEIKKLLEDQQLNIVAEKWVFTQIQFIV